MRFKLKEEEILEALRLHYPEQTFDKGRLLVGQNKRNNLHVFYLGEQDYFAVLTVEFTTFNFIETSLFPKSQISEIRLKDALLFRKMYVTFELDGSVVKYGTSKALISDFQQANYNKFIDGEKEKVIYKDGQFL